MKKIIVTLLALFTLSMFTVPAGASTLNLNTQSKAIQAKSVVSLQTQQQLAHRGHGGNWGGHRWSGHRGGYGGYYYSSPYYYNYGYPGYYYYNPVGYSI